MKKAIIMSSALILGLLFSGCPYESAVPIDKATVPIEQKILGKWKTEDGNEAYTVSKKDEFTYAIEGKKENSPADLFTGFLSRVNGTLFLNLSPVKEENKFHFYKIELPDDNTLKIFPVTENIREKFTTSEELKKFFSANMKNSYFFEREGKLMRIGKE